MDALRLYIDMDGVLCDIAQGYEAVWRVHPEIRYPQSVPGLFEGLAPIPNAIPTVNCLRHDPRFDVWILSAPSVRNPHCYAEKRIWVEKHFDYSLAKRLILSTNKGLLKGDVLVDDHQDGKGQEDFAGVLMQFGSKQYPDWQAVEAAIYQLAQER